MLKYEHQLSLHARAHTPWRVLTLIERLMVLKMATTCRRASTQTTWTRQELKRTEWLCRLEGGKATPVNGCVWLSGSDFSWSQTEYSYIYRKPLTGPFPWSLQCFLLRDAPPVGPRFLSLNMIRGAIPSLSLINNETNCKEKTQRQYLQLGYLSHYECAGENIF